MNIISCDHCGVVLDGDKLPFHENIYDGDGVIDDKRATWDGENYIPLVKCPCCGKQVLQDG